jgi:putative addiction module antidote
MAKAALTVEQTGTVLSIAIPDEVAERLGIKAGDTLFAIDLAGGVLLTPFDPHFEEAMGHYRRGAKRYRSALRELAR